MQYITTCTQQDQYLKYKIFFCENIYKINKFLKIQCPVEHLISINSELIKLIYLLRHNVDTDNAINEMIKNSNIEYVRNLNQTDIFILIFLNCLCGNYIYSNYIIYIDIQIYNLVMKIDKLLKSKFCLNEIYKNMMINKIEQILIKENIHMNIAYTMYMKMNQQHREDRRSIYENPLYHKK